jgi:site-specific recombinase XerD
MLWLIREEKVSGLDAADFYPFFLHKSQLPSLAVKFISTQKENWTPNSNRKYAQTLHLFYTWMGDRDLTPKQLTRENIKSFIAFVDRRGYQPKMAYIVKLRVRMFLDYIRDRCGGMDADYNDLFSKKPQYRNFVLPKEATRYVEELSTHLRPETVLSYKTDMVGFYRYLRDRKLKVADFNRRESKRWMKFLLDRELRPNTRIKVLINVKHYLTWLYENRLFDGNAEHIIRGKDLPKSPKFLPKPIPPEIDREIQARFENSENFYHKGLLLLRYTGMRLGELSNMPFQCVHTDETGRKFIKVPIGKMYNERMIPLDDKGVRLVEDIQRRSIPILIRFGKNPITGPLMLSPEGFNPKHSLYKEFKTICRDIKVKDSLHPHRLRHTFATTLLNAGVELTSLMRLMGHKDIKTTLRYAAIVQTTIYREYFAAMKKIESEVEWKTPESASGNPSFDPHASISDTVRWLKRNLAENSSAESTRQADLIIKRLIRIKSELEKLK